MSKKKNRKDRDDDDNGFAAWGGYMAAKKAKLEDQFLLQAGKTTGEKSNIFKGIAIFVNGYTAPTANELKMLMMLHGGVYHHYESHSTTHIIASNLPDTKVKKLKTLNVVKPTWITDSVAAGTLLDFRKYLLYSNQTKSQPHLRFAARGDLVSANSKEMQPLVSEATDKNITTIGAKDNLSENVNAQSSSKLGASASSELSPNQRPSFDGVSKAGAGSCAVSPLKSRGAGASRKTAVEPEFLSEFYGNSRLHHLSTMGALFKEYVAKLRERRCEDCPGIKRLSDWKRLNAPGEFLGDDDLIDDLAEDTFIDKGRGKVAGGPRTIMHIDMDCFFVSVGLRKWPELRGSPVAVTHAKGNTSRAREGADRQYEVDFYKQRFQSRMKQKQGDNGSVEIEAGRMCRLDDIGENDSLSEIASCNYEARKAGVKNGMFFGTALKLCPELKAIPYDFEGYKEVSYMLYDTLASYTLDIEAVSCDEMYVDCTEVLKKTNVTALEFATFLRAEILEATGCTASAGFGSNPLQARLATRKAKPNGQFQLQPRDVELFMHSIKVEDLPGVGHSLAYRLHAEGIVTCRDLQWLSLESLQKKFGARTGETLHQHAKGEDKRALDVCHKRKSVSAEVNYGIRFTVQAEAEVFLRQLAEEVVVRMRQARVRGRQVTLKLMVRAKDAPIETAKFMGHGACDHISRSTTLGAPTDDADIIYREAVALERQQKVLASDLRGVGIQMSRLEHLTSKVAVKESALTRFLRRSKAQEGDRKASNEEGSVGDATSKNEMSADICSKPKTVPSAKSIESDYAVEKPSCRDVQKKVGKQVANYFLPEREKVDESGNKTKNEILKDDPSKGKGASDSIPVTPKNGPLPVLSPPIEVPMMTLAQARKLVRAWVTSEDNPQNCDAVMFASHLQRLVMGRHLEDVDILFSLLHRLLINKGQKWKSAYKDIVKNTQVVMQIVYGADLLVPEFD